MCAFFESCFFLSLSRERAPPFSRTSEDFFRRQNFFLPHDDASFSPSAGGSTASPLLYVLCFFLESDVLLQLLFDGSFYMDGF